MSDGPAGGAGGAGCAGSGFSCAVCGAANAAVCARCRLVGYCGVEHQRKDWKAHKSVCRPGEFGMVAAGAPALGWEQRALAAAAAEAPASLAAAAALPPYPEWDVRRGPPPAPVLAAWRELAGGGHSRAQNALGSYYAECARDDASAVVWFGKAAAQGLAAAQYNFASALADGKHGLQKDVREAFAIMAKSAAQGDARAACHLGMVLNMGADCTRDGEAAARFFAQAAAAGDAHGQFLLGFAYMSGQGVPADEQRARRLFELSAAAPPHAASGQARQLLQVLRSQQQRAR